MRQIQTVLPTVPAQFVSSFALVTLLIGATIAAIAPFDRAFATLTHGSALARVCLLVTLGLIGIYCSNLNGFALHKRGAQPVIVGALCALGVAVYVALIDAWLFRAVVPRSYIEFFHTHDLPHRMLYYMLRAFNENVLYRLFAFSTLGYVLAQMSKRRAISFVISMVVVQVVNVGINIVPTASDPVTPLFLIYFAFRGVVPGVVWGALFWRFGFVAAEIGSVGCHVFLQPMLGALL
jgi:hypothetical protein